VRTFPVGDGPVGIALSPDGSSAYVTNYRDDTVSVIDTELAEAGGDPVVATIPIPLGNPYGIAVSPDGKRVYSMSVIPAVVSVIDPSLVELGQDPVIGTVQVGPLSSAIAVSPHGTRLYAADTAGGAVSVLDPESIGSGQSPLIATVPVGEGPKGIAVSPDGRYVYTADAGDETVSVIDTTRIGTGGDPVIASVGVGREPTWVSIAPDGSAAYVRNAGDNTVSILDLASNPPRVAETVEIGGSGSNHWYAGLAITPNQPPEAGLSAPAKARTGVPAEFDVSPPTDDLGVQTAVLDFGDGTTRSVPAGGTFKHTYTEPGTYETTLTVDDGEGCEPVPALFAQGLPSPFTGQTAHCNGPSRVTYTQTVEVADLPRLRLVTALKRPQSSLRALRITATCRNVECRARAFGRIEVRRPGRKALRFALDADRGELAAEAPTALVPRIPAEARRAARKALRSGGKVRARVRVAAEAPGDQRRVVLRRVRIAR